MNILYYNGTCQQWVEMQLVGTNLATLSNKRIAQSQLTN